ncbi:MAG: sensor histidine kinase [Flavobacteriaceae bacterium]
MKTIDLYLSIQDSPACIAILDKKMNILSYSKKLIEESNIDNDMDITGIPYYEIFPEYPFDFRNITKDLFQDQSLLEKIERHAIPGKSTRWFKWKVYSWMDQSEGMQRYTVVRENVTELKRNEELMAKSLGVARIGGWEVDLTNNQVFWTEITREIHEVDTDYVPNLEEGINFYKAGQDREKITALVSDGISEGKPWDTELQIVTAKGREVWVRAKGESEMVDGKCVRLFGTFQDIDEAKKVELKYQVVSDRLSVATTAANVGVWDYNLVDNVLVWDDNMYNLYGIRKEDFSGVYEAWEAAVHPEDQEEGKERVQMAISGEKEFDTEFRVVWPSGEIRYIRAFAITQRDPDGIAMRMIGTNWDITEIRMSDRKLKNLLDITSEQNKSLMNFAHIVSHNLRSHSSNLSMLTGFLSKENNEQERIRLVKMLDEASESLNETVQHLNEVVQVKTSTAEKMKPVNLLKAVKTVQKNLTVLLNEKNASCSFDIPKSLDIQAIPAYLDSILLNLFTNSIKYSSQERDLKLEISTRVDGPHLLLSFSDNGLGIDLDRHGDKIFGMYKTFHRHKDSKGIGLFITKNQIEAMNGKIEIDSKVNEGTTFHLCFVRSNPNKNKE